LHSAYEIGAYAPLGLICGAVAILFIRAMDWFEAAAARLPVRAIWKPAVGGLVLGAMILAVPNLYGVGYLTMDGALSGTLSWQLLALLLPAKLAATSITLASGGSGGVFLPSLYLGSIAGGLYGSALHGLMPEASAGSGHYALVGMAGVLAAATHSPITALVLLFELSGDYKIILPVMLVVTLATLVARSVQADSLYSRALARSGVKLHRREDVIMRSHTVGEVMRPPGFVLAAATPIGEVIAAFLERTLVRAYVIDTEGRLVGEISILDIQNPEIRSLGALGSLVNAHDLAAAHRRAVRVTHTLAECLDEFVWEEREELPVVDAAGKLVGLISRRDLLRVYANELLTDEFLGIADRSRGAARPRSEVHLRPGLVTDRVPVPPALVGRSLREANVRSAHHVSVVAVRRPGEEVESLPDPEAPLTQGTILVVVGGATEVAQFREACEAGRAS
jgi:CIC family chloride channel protein